MHPILLDWIISPYESLYKALEDAFSWFFKELELVDSRTSTKDRYGFNFHHVWHEKLPGSEPLGTIDWQSLIPSITEKLNRKIERFRGVCNSNRPVVFVRYESIDKHKSIELKDLIRSKYPNLTFVLMVVEPSEDFEEPWGLENISNFSIIYNDSDKWRAAFKEVALKFDSELTIDGISEVPREETQALRPDGT